MQSEQNLLMKSGYETDFQNWKQFFKVRSETIKVQWQCIWQREIQSLHVPERIFLHLVESKNDDAPFAFIATYASRQSDGSVQHMPLQYALTEYRDDREKLLTLLSSLNRAAEVSPLIAELMEVEKCFTR